MNLKLISALNNSTTMPHYFVKDHLGRTLVMYTDLKTNAGAERRALRNHSTATILERWNVTDTNPRPYYNPNAKPCLSWRVDCNR